MIKIIVFLICIISFFIITFFYEENEKGYPVLIWWISLIAFVISLSYAIFLDENGNHYDHHYHHHIIKL